MSNTYIHIYIHTDQIASYDTSNFQPFVDYLVGLLAFLIFKLIR